MLHMLSLRISALFYGCDCKYLLVFFFFLVPQHHEEEEISTSPAVSEFVSDAFDSCNINQEDLRKEMEQLVLDKKKEDGELKGVLRISGSFNSH